MDIPKQPSSPTAGDNPFIKRVEQQVRESLQAGKWRRARDDAKELCKADRARFLPLLIEANLGLTREMIKKGLISEAKQVIVYLKTIASPEQIRVLELDLVSHSGPTEVAGIALLNLLAAKDLPEAEKQRMADRLVTLFQPAASQPEEGRIAGELAAILTALEAVSAGNFSAAAESLRPVSQQSVFSHWKMYVKGLIAFHQGEREKALRLFDSIPSATVPARATEPYRALLAPSTDHVGAARLSATGLEAICQLCGHGGLAEPLSRAETGWKNKSWMGSYQAMKGCPGFPALNLDWQGMLTEFYFKAAWQVPHTALDSYQDFLECARIGRGSLLLERVMAARTLCVCFPPDRSQLGSEWRQFVEWAEQLWGSRPKWASLAYEWLGFTLMAEEKAPDFPGLRFQEKPGGFLEALQTSVKLDPANLSAHLLLCAGYEKQNKTSERNRLLDEMSQRFPDSKEVLIKAGKLCVERKAYKKGIAYLEKARQMDLVDPNIPALLLEAQLGLAETQYGRQTAKARQGLEAALSLTTDNPENLGRCQWLFQTRWAMLELGLGDFELGKDRWAEARAAAPFEAAFYMAVHFLDKTLFLPPGESLEIAWARLCKEAMPARAPYLFRLWYHMQPEGLGITTYAVPGHWELMDRYIKGLLKKPVTLAEARAILEIYLRQPLTQLKGVLQNLVKAARKIAPNDPYMRVVQHYLNAMPGCCSRTIEKEMQKLVEESVQWGDQAAASLARKLLEEARRQNQLPPSPFDPSFFDDDEEWDAEEADYDAIYCRCEELLIDYLPTEVRESVFDQILEITNELAHDPLMEAYARRNLRHLVNEATVKKIIEVAKEARETAEYDANELDDFDLPPLPPLPPWPKLPKPPKPSKFSAGPPAPKPKPPPIKPPEPPVDDPNQSRFPF